MNPKVVRSQVEECLKSENRAHCAWVLKQRFPVSNEARCPLEIEKNTKAQAENDVLDFLSTSCLFFYFGTSAHTLCSPWH